MTRTLLKVILFVVLALAWSVPVASAQAPAPLELTVDIDDATVSREGVVTLTATVTCSMPVDINLFVEVTQPVTRLRSVRGFAGSFGPTQCEEQETFTLTVIPQNGRFRQGTAFIRANTMGCVFEPEPGFEPNCDFAQTVEVVELRWAS